MRSALGRIGWRRKRWLEGSHEILEREGWADYIWAFHDRVEIGPGMLARIAKKTALTPADL